MSEFIPHFTTAEMLGSGAMPGEAPISRDDFNYDFLDELVALRVLTNLPMFPTSVARTHKYLQHLIQAGYEASENSYHLCRMPNRPQCCAIDIRRSFMGTDLVKLMKMGLNRGWSFGIAKSFIHMDLRTICYNQPQVVYTYK